MDVNAAIIDQRVSALADEVRERVAAELGIKNDEPKIRSVAFVFLCVRTLLDLDFDEAFDCLVEGGQDFGVDAIHLTEERDGEFTATLFQGKYSTRLDGKAGFPATGIEKLVQAVRHLFDPSSTLHTINARLRTRVEEVRSMIRDGYIPQVRVIACNNGQRWEMNGAETIRLAGLGEQVTWEYVNHEHLVRILQATKPVNDTLQLTGEALVEDMNFSRVLVGRIAVEHVFQLIQRNGERLLERNIRRYLGLYGNRVNEDIQSTLMGDERQNFYFYNNGITLTCDKFSYNALQSRDYRVNVENLQIINGGQTCMTIHRTLASMAQGNLLHAPASVLLRLYQLPSDNEDLVRRITYATNSQNPVDLRDLRANDELQQRLEFDIEQLGFHYRRKRTSHATTAKDITSGAAAQAILAVWRARPQQAKFYSREHFGKLYDVAFVPDLTGAEVVIAVLLYRVADSRRRRPRDSDPGFVRYASAFIAMQMGRRLRASLGVTRIGHRDFERACIDVDQNGESYFEASLADVEIALKQLYGNREISEISWQQLAATFRRGDLIDRLQAIDVSAP